MITHIMKTNLKWHDGSYLHTYKCFCGTLFESLPRYVISKKTVSCGCYRKSVMKRGGLGRTPGNALKDPTESAFNAYYAQYKHSAKFKNREFSLDKNQFKRITQGDCHYCGVKPSHEHSTLFSRKAYVTNGIDRLRNNAGYTFDNCVACCSDCNYFKGDRDEDEFLNLIKKIADQHSRWIGR